MLRQHTGFGRFQVPSGDLMITVNRVYVTCEAPTLGQTHALTALETAVSPSVSSSPYLQEAGTNDALTVTPTVLDTQSADITIGNVEVGSGLFHLVAVPSGDSAPSAAQIQAGTDASDVDAVWSDTRSVLNNDDVTIEAFGLSAVSYKIYVAHESIDTTLSAVASSAAFTPADVTAPQVTSVIGVAGADYTEATIATVTFNTDTGEGTADLVLTQSGTAPTSTQVGNGQDENGAAADVVATPLTITTSGPQMFSLTGLASSGAVTYYPYVIQTDAAGNVSDVGEAPVSFTTPSATIVRQFFDDGLQGSASINSNTITESYTDPNAGSNAVLLSSGASATSMLFTHTVVYANGVNEISFSVRDVTKSTAKRWMRIRPGNVSTTTLAHVNITDGVFSGSSGGDNQAVQDLGGGWYRFSYTLDMTDDADLNGILQFWPADADNDTTIPRGSAGAEEIAVFDVRVTSKTNAVTASEATLGAISVDAATAGQV